MDYEKIVSEYADMIYKIAIRYLKNKDDAEDIVQEVFMKYVSNKTPFKNSEHEKYWIIRVTINICNNEISSGRKRKTIISDEIDEYEKEVPFENTLSDLIDKLSEKYRTVFELYYLQDFSVSEISKILMITEASVRQRLMRARNKVKDNLRKGE
jgi:RNA polymerase sigma-70 factor (ECF subfamily)